MKRSLFWTIAFLVCGLIAWYLVTQVDWSVMSRLSAIDVAVLALSTLAMMLLHSAAAMLLLQGLGHRTSVWAVFAAMMGSSTVSITGDPKLGVPARLAFYRAFAGVPIALGMAQVGIETILWFLWIGIILVVSGLNRGDSDLFLSLLVGGGVLTAIVLVVFGPGLLERTWLLGRLFRSSPRIHKFVYDVHGHVLGISRPFLAWATLTLGSTYMVDIASIWYLGHALGFDLPAFAIAHAIVTSHLAGAISMLPLGLGVRDVTFALLLENAGASHDAAAIMAVVHRAIRTALPLLIGLLLVATFPRLRLTGGPKQ